MIDGAALPAATSSRLAELLETIAHSKYAMGRQLADLGPGAPALEAATAACALAQGELGHARLLYRLAAQVRGEVADSWQDDKAEPDTGKAFPYIDTAALRWVDLVSALYVTDTAIDLVTECLLRSGLALLHSLRKLVAEQRTQLLYAEGWLHVFGREQGGIPGAAKQCIMRMAPDVEQWLVNLGSDEALAQAGLVPAGEALSKRFGDRVNALLHESGLVA